MNRIVIIAVISVMLFSCKQSVPRGTAEIGQKAPGFSLKDLKGNVVTLDDLKGKVVLLEFWATWCPPCRESVPELNDIHKKFTGSDFKLLAISVDEGKNVSDYLIEFETDHGSIYTILISDDLTTDLYGITSIPVMFLLDKEHTIVKKYSGYSPGMTEEITKDIEGLL